MRIVGRQILAEFAARHPPARSWIEAWLKEVEEATWQGPQDIKDRHRTASFLANQVVIFNVRGNSYRLEVQVSFENAVVSIRRYGTHAEYDRWEH